MAEIGRPPHYNTPEELESKINEYFTNCPDKRMVKLRDSEGGEYIDYVPCFTVCGLALYLGFVSRQSMYDYDKRNDAFSYIIKKARCAIEKNYEMNLQNPQCAGSIFALKNMGWKDKQEIEHSEPEDIRTAYLEHMKSLKPSERE